MTTNEFFFGLQTSEPKYRLFPGEGEFPLKENYTLLKKIGATSSVGIELFSDKVDQMSPEEVGSKSKLAIQTLNN